MRFIRTAENLFSLPLGFQRIEYLESSGTQYIDTGYKPVPATTKFEFYFSPTTITGNYFLFGARPDTSIGGFTCTTYFATGNIRQDWAGLGSYFPKINAGDKVLYSAYNNTVSLNNDSATGTVVRSTTRSDYNFLLFTVNTGGTVDSRMYVGKVYYAKLWDNGVLVRDFIPCIDPLGVPCMYDLVGKKPYYNQGTGTFNVGRQVIPVEYLESTGTQYINTMIKSGVNMSVKTKFNLLDVSAKAVLGSYSGSASNGVGVFFGTAGGNISGKVYCNNTNVAVSPDLTLSANTDYEIEMSGTTLIVNGSTYTSATTADNNYNMNLFARSNNGTIERQISGKIYYFTIKDSGVLIANFIPCKDENNVGFMFDTLSGTVYLNAGTGAFSVGEPVYTSKLRLIRDTDGKVRFVQDVLPREYRPLKYLESSGTQFILTGFTPTTNTDFELELSSTKTSTNWAMGCPTWVGVHYKGADGQIGITNSSTSGFQQYINYARDNTRITMKLQGNTVYADGVSLGTITRRAGTLDFALFGYRDANRGATLLFTGSIYKCIIWDNGVPVRDFYPALRKSDNKPGMYDRITKQFFTNAAQSGNDFNYG